MKNRHPDGRERVHLLIGMVAFNLDFHCIHPFRDGNGRVSRLLLLPGEKQPGKGENDERSRKVTYDPLVICDLFTLLLLAVLNLFFQRIVSENQRDAS